MTKWVLIALGGAIGSVLRFALSGWVQRNAHTDFPFGTLAVNLIGCLLIGFLATLFSGLVPIRDEYRLGVMVGVLGGFTTFSAFGLETFTAVQTGQVAGASFYVAVSCGAGLLAVWAGHLIAHRAFGG